MSMYFRKDKNWQKFAKALDSNRWRSLAQRNIEVATGRVAHAIKATVKKKIQKKEFEANAALTVSIKKSSTPLVDKGIGIFGAIAVQQPEWNTAFIGVLRSDRRYNIARALHNGTNIKVTPKMRAMFRFLWLASEGRDVQLTGAAAALFGRMNHGWKPLRDSTKAIKIPARPFIKDAVDAPEVKRFAQQQWRDAVQRTLKEMAAA